MAVTALTYQGSREFAEVFLFGTTSAVAMDALVDERYTLPTGIGELMLYNVMMVTGTFSGAHAAGTPDRPGIKFEIEGADAATTVDMIGVKELLARSTGTSAALHASLELYRKVIIRPGERIHIVFGGLGAAGVTASVSCALRGTRVRS